MERENVNNEFKLITLRDRFCHSFIVRGKTLLIVSSGGMWYNIVIGVIISYRIVAIHFNNIVEDFYWSISVW